MKWKRGHPEKVRHSQRRYRERKALAQAFAAIDSNSTDLTDHLQGVPQ